MTTTIHHLSHPLRCGSCGHLCWWVWSKRLGGGLVRGAAQDTATEPDYEWSCPACHKREPGWDNVTAVCGQKDTNDDDNDDDNDN